MASDKVMRIDEWANLNGMTPDEFAKSIAETMAAIAGDQLDKRAGMPDSAGMVFTVRDGAYEYKVIIARKEI